MPKTQNSIVIKCTTCERLARFLVDVREKYPDYYAAPVPAFGVANPRLLIVGLAPGLHGANKTGRPFTGDFAGILLYETLYELGLSNQSAATHVRDGLKLNNCRITNAVKCVPPQNKPVGQEIRNCNSHLRKEIEGLSKGTVILALGTIAHNAVLRALQLKLSEFPFKHGAAYALDHQRWLISSYHCSRYNTQTRRLSKEMFLDVFKQAQKLMLLPGN